METITGDKTVEYSLSVLPFRIFLRGVVCFSPLYPKKALEKKRIISYG